MTIRTYNLILVILFLIIGCSNDQESLSDLNESWVELKAQLQRRNELGLTLIADITKPDSVAQNSIETIRAGVADFKRFIDSTTNLDSLTVQLTKQKALESVRVISVAMSLRMNDPDFKKEGFRDLQSELEGAENRINVAKKNFNNLCAQYKRMDLLYDKR